MTMQSLKNLATNYIIVDGNKHEIKGVSFDFVGPTPCQETIYIHIGYDSGIFSHACSDLEAPLLYYVFGNCDNSFNIEITTNPKNLIKFDFVNSITKKFVYDEVGKQFKKFIKIRGL